MDYLAPNHAGEALGLATKDEPSSHSCGHAEGHLCEAHRPLDSLEIEALCGVFSQNLVHRAHSLLGSTDLAEDAVQEAFVALWKESPAPLEPKKWLGAAVRLRALQMLRSQKRRAHRELEYVHQREAYHASSEPEPCPVCKMEELGVLETSLARMPQADARLLSRFFFDGASYSALSEEYGIPIATVGTRLHRAKQALRNSMAEFEPEIPTDSHLHKRPPR